MRKRAWKNNDVAGNCSCLGKNVLCYMIFKSIIEIESWFGFWSKFALNSCDITENNFWKSGFKNIAIYKRGWCRINMCFVIIWTLTPAWMLRFPGDDGTRLEHLKGSGYFDRWTDVRYKLYIIYRNACFMIVGKNDVNVFHTLWSWSSEVYFVRIHNEFGRNTLNLRFMNSLNTSSCGRKWKETSLKVDWLGMLQCVIGCISLRERVEIVFGEWLVILLVIEKKSDFLLKAVPVRAYLCAFRLSNQWDNWSSFSVIGFVRFSS